MKLLNYVKLFEGKSNEKRREILIKILKSKKYNFTLENYSYFGKEGVNIIVKIGEGKKDILATTHYDVVSGSPGANDCASGIAVLLDLLRRLKKYKPNNCIKVIIFDQEELYCTGARAYIRKHGMDNIIGMYNLELVGIGDMVGIWPVTKDIEDDIVLNNLRQTLKQNKVYFEEAAKLPLFYGDHLPFRQKGFKSAITISILPHKDKEKIRKFVETSELKIRLGLLIGAIKIPFMFQLYHTSEDKSKYLNEGALQLCSAVLFKAVVNLDKRFGRKYS